MCSVTAHVDRKTPCTPASCPSEAAMQSDQAGPGRLFVSTSAAFSLPVPVHVTKVMTPSLTRSQTQYRRVSMCLASFRLAGLLATSVDARSIPHPRSSARRYTTSSPAIHAATCRGSASAELSVTQSSRFAFHSRETGAFQEMEVPSPNDTESREKEFGRAVPGHGG
eukprot:1820163-Rhodomonas_salina.2